jgi:hypothetical protein
LLHQLPGNAVRRRQHTHDGSNNKSVLPVTR